MLDKMPISFSNDNNNQILRSELEGDLTDADLIEAYTNLYKSEDWKPEYPELVDFTRANMGKITSHGLRELSKICKQALAGKKIIQSPTAVIAPADLQYGLARMYSGVTENSPEQVQVFRDETSAIAWLNQVRFKDTG